MARRSPYTDATIACMECRIPEWHPTTECEHSGEEEVRRLQKLRSDLFNLRERDVPAPQKEIMDRNYSTSPFLRLPPEIRLSIYRLVLGGQQLWIGHTGSKLEKKKPRKTVRAQEAQLEQSCQWFHRWGGFYHYPADIANSANPFNSALCLSLLRACRQIYIETALLPYALNAFTFKNDSVRKLFEQSARPGKKRVQKKAIGRYEIGTLSEFLIRHTPSPVCVLDVGHVWSYQSGVEIPAVGPFRIARRMGR